MRIVCVSDIHARPIETPEADVLIIAGDFTYRSSDKDLEWFAQWLKAQKAKYKIFIAGNHDKKFKTHPWTKEQYLKRVCAETNTHYLEQTSVTIEGLVFWGSPWIPHFNFGAKPRRRTAMDELMTYSAPVMPSSEQGVFLLKGPSHAREHWANMPDTVDVLITHGPPHGILDSVNEGKQVGDQHLLEAVQRVKPRLHVFGHIHSGHGQVEIDGTIFVNACVCDEDYNPIQPPIIIDLPTDKR